ncbi:MAG TPA: efflux RND transporter periplasmic adaptor subunit [bacterium]|nr:efflux RND transporter periplasmic adaptor subunit [bacterium]
MKKNIIRSIIVIFLIILVWRLIVLFSSGAEKTRGGGRPPLAVKVDSVRIGNIAEISSFTGTVYPLYQYVVAPKVAGRVVQITKRIGDWANRAEIICRIDDAEYQQAVLEAEANLKIARASLNESKSQLELTQQELSRARSLYEKGISSPAELDAAMTNFNAAQSRLKLAQAQVEHREASLQSARIRLGYTILVASEPGYIGERYVDEGTLLAPNTPVASIIGIDRVLIQTTIIERIYGRIRPGQKAEVTVDAYPTKRFYGKVSRIAPMLQEATRVARMEVEVDNDSLLLKPGMFANLNIVLESKPSALLVPAEAIITTGDESAVFMVHANQETVHYVAVKTGIITKQHVEIISPQLSGLVVTLGQHLLEEGSPVILPEIETTQPADSPAGEE